MRLNADVVALKVKRCRLQVWEAVTLSPVAIDTSHISQRRLYNIVRVKFRDALSLTLCSGVRITGSSQPNESIIRQKHKLII